MVAFANTRTLTPHGTPNIGHSVLGRMLDPSHDVIGVPAPVIDLCVIFRNKIDCLRFQMRLVSVGGIVLEVGKVVEPEFWFESVDEANNLIGL